MGRGLDVRPVLSHPIFMITFILAIAGWFSAFIGQAVTEARWHAAGGSGSPVGVAWFAIFLQAFINISVFYTLATDSVSTQRFQLSVFLSMAVVLAVLAVNTGIFTTNSPQLALAGGWLVLSVVDILWLLFFSADEESFLVHLFHTGSRTTFSSHGSAAARRSTQTSNLSQTGVGYHNSYSGVGNNKGGMGGLQAAGLSVGELSGGHGDDLSGGHLGSGGGHGNTRSPTIGGTSMMSQQPEYLLKAKALYSYSASPDDPNEISFTKGDLLDIVDNSGKWWQARKADGTKGIVPSNYVVLQ